MYLQIAPDAPILSIDGGASSTLLSEAKKAAASQGSKLAIICFDAITCPFFRAYAAEDLHKAANGVPQLHVYLREAEPCDVFDAGGMHCVTPLKMKRYIPWHKNEGERAQAAKDTRTFLEGFEVGKAHCCWHAQHPHLSSARLPLTIESCKAKVSPTLAAPTLVACA